MDSGIIIITNILCSLPLYLLSFLYFFSPMFLYLNQTKLSNKQFITCSIQLFFELVILLWIVFPSALRRSNACILQIPIPHATKGYMSPSPSFLRHISARYENKMSLHRRSLSSLGIYLFCTSRLPWPTTYVFIAKLIDFWSNYGQRA